VELIGDLRRAALRAIVLAILVGGVAGAIFNDQALRAAGTAMPFAAVLVPVSVIELMAGRREPTRALVAETIAALWLVSVVGTAWALLLPAYLEGLITGGSLRDAYLAVTIELPTPTGQLGALPNFASLVGGAALALATIATWNAFEIQAWWFDQARGSARAAFVAGLALPGPVAGALTLTSAHPLHAPGIALVVTIGMLAVAAPASVVVAVAIALADRLDARLARAPADG
jgi:hypothetical protein